MLLILHVFQVDMIYMYHNSGVVYKCSQLTTLEIYFEMELHITSVAGKRVQYLFFFNFVAWCKAFALYEMQRQRKHHMSTISLAVSKVLSVYHFKLVGLHVRVGYLS